MELAFAKDHRQTPKREGTLMKNRIKLLAAALTLLGANAHAGWTGAYYVNKVITLSANQSIPGNPIVEVCQVTLSNGTTYGFYLNGPTQKGWYDLATLAIGQGKKIQFMTYDTPARTITYSPRYCFDSNSEFTCTTQPGSVSLPSVSGISFERL